MAKEKNETQDEVSSPISSNSLSGKTIASNHQRIMEKDQKKKKILVLKKEQNRF